jgi:DNA polymerase elongation subunit (family B)
MPKFGNNNYKKKIVHMGLLDTCDYIETKKPILSASGVLFQRHENSTNLLYKVIDEFVEDRDIAKKTMFKYPKGSELFQYWNLQQLLAKRNVNALYGAQGQYSCILYNLHTAESTTTQGRSIISSSILFFEA